MIMSYEKFAWLPGKLALVLLVFTLALDRSSVARNLPYTATYVPINAMTGPFSGDMRLTFNRGAISGIYNDTSKRAQAPLFAQRNATVIGSIDTEGNVIMHIGHVLDFRGTIKGQLITGIAIVDGRKYNFRAHPTTST
jgi:hypothetical protein